MVISLTIVQITVSNSLSTKGIVLGKLNDEIKYYKTQNSILKEQVLKASSLTYIASQASTLGFVESNKVTYINTSAPVALQQ